MSDALFAVLIFFAVYGVAELVWNLLNRWKRFRQRRKRK